MVLDVHDTIAAIGTAAGPAARGMVRVSGPDCLACVARSFTPTDAEQPWQSLTVPHAVSGTFHTNQWQIAGRPPHRVPSRDSPSRGPLAVGQRLSDHTNETNALEIPCDVFVWPSQRSYTRQPTAEIHTLGSPPLLDCLLKEICTHGARLAEPGEFTLRAFLAGRVDLTQAEAVLGVIDARGQDDLETALSQLAGGLSQPLSILREQLIQVLAELEAGLDFVEEDIQFISSVELHRQLSDAQGTLLAVSKQISGRTAANQLPRVVLTGPPNVGKSSLFNALVEFRGSRQVQDPAIVSEHPGTTRDYLTAKIDLGDLVCELVDTAGEEAAAESSSIEAAAQGMTDAQRRQADLQLLCCEASASGAAQVPKLREDQLLVLTKADRQTPSTESSYTPCSSVTGEGLEELCQQIRRQLPASTASSANVVASTAIRCGESLRLASDSLTMAMELAQRNGGDELIAAEVRVALVELGRVVGAVYTDDILDRIFGQFCIGK